ncbi:MAG: hypothetical protein GY903_29395 [Fuerstiella sp.]|jgi:hypothetical protein|nr:hypothetical protein [Fuerstiella sp.]MCP4858613.1 hypothetical protein [Fuerstiella sp.]
MDRIRATAGRLITLLFTVHLTTQVAAAGMPSITLTDLSRLRLSTLSFFLVVCLLTAWGLQAIWNSLRQDFQKLPLLSYKGAVAGVFLWGLVFVVVLTMISGARELMMPGAWEKNGLTYRLADQPKSTDADSISAEVARQLNERTERMQQLQKLGLALQQFSADYGRFPNADEFKELPQDVRQLPGSVAADYIYVAPAAEASQAGARVVAFEPAVFQDSLQMAWYQSGHVAPLSEDGLPGPYQPAEQP